MLPGGSFAIVTIAFITVIPIDSTILSVIIVEQKVKGPNRKKG